MTLGVPGVVFITLSLALINVGKPSCQLWSKCFIKMHFVNAEIEGKDTALPYMTLPGRHLGHGVHWVRNWSSLTFQGTYSFPFVWCSHHWKSHPQGVGYPHPRAGWSESPVLSGAKPFPGHLAGALVIGEVTFRHRVNSYFSAGVDCNSRSSSWGIILLLSGFWPFRGQSAPPRLFLAARLLGAKTLFPPLINSPLRFYWESPQVILLGV